MGLESVIVDGGCQLTGMLMDKVVHELLGSLTAIDEPLNLVLCDHQVISVVQSTIHQTSSGEYPWWLCEAQRHRQARNQSGL